MSRGAHPAHLLLKGDGEELTVTSLDDGTYRVSALHVPSGSSTVHVVVAGYASRTITLPATPWPVIDVELTRSARIEGRVVTGGAKPVAGAVVRATRADTPLDARYSVAVVPVGTGVSEAPSDAEGSFSVEVSPDSLYYVDARVPGAVESLGYDRAREDLVRPGTTGHLVRVALPMFTRLRLVDKESGSPINRNSVLVGVKPGPGIRQHPGLDPARVFTESGWLAICGPSDPVGVLTAYVEVTGEMTSQPEFAEILIQVEDYKNVAARARLLDYKAFLSGEMEDVYLSPRSPRPVGAIKVDLAAIRTDYWSPTRRMLRADDAQGVIRLYRGRQLGETQWVFDGVVAGDLTIRVSDSVVWSDPIAISLPANGELLAKIVMPEPTGMAATVQDEDGAPIFGTKLYVGGQGTMAIDVNLKLWEAPPLDNDRQVVYRMEPGRYYLRVEAPGYQLGEVSFEIAARKVTPVLLQLRRKK